MSKCRLKWDESQSGRSTEGLNPVIHLQFVINVCEMKVHRPFGHVQSISRFLAAVALCNQT